MTRPIIDVRGVSKRYRLGHLGMTSFRDELHRFLHRTPREDTRDFWALRDVSFAIEPVAVVGIIGHNGAGKSTLLKILSRITEPTTGEIHLRGRVASLLEVGTGFHPELSGRENIFLNGTILGMTRAEIARKFDEIVAFAEVEQFIDTPVKRYSSGMYVRLAFAVAAHLEPEILILDEVLAVGDQAFQQKCIGKMQSVAHQGGRTILFVSHHMSAIRRLCRQCIVLQKGRASELLAVDAAVDLYTAQYRSDGAILSIDTRESPRDGTRGRQVKIVRLAALGTPALSFGAPLHLELTLEVIRPVEGAMVGVDFETREGHRVMTMASDAAGGLLNFAPGRHVVSLRLAALTLHPSQYEVTAVVAVGAHFLDIVARCATWDITTSLGDHGGDRGNGGWRTAPLVSVQAAS